MGHKLLVVLYLALIPGCALFRPCHRPAKAPPEQAAQYRFPVALPTEGQHVLPGRIAAAIALAMEDFLPLGAKPARDASPAEVCMFQRESYDVTAVAGEDDVIFIRFAVRGDACRELSGPSIADVPIIYAVDAGKWVILSVQK